MHNGNGREMKKLRQAAMVLFGFGLRRETKGSGTYGENIKLRPHTFIVSWGVGEDGRFGGGVTITDGWCGVPEFESTLRSCSGGQHGGPALG